jgi:glycosyltransferase involved in cell wall biosynthesis
MNPLVTLYIANYNYSKYLDKCIQSVISQDYDNIEVLIIDDGSTDNSKAIIDKYKSQPNVTCFYNQNQGLISTANFALAKTKGEYFIRLDADDWLETNAISILVETIRNQYNSIAVFPGYYLVDEKGKVLGQENRGESIRALQFDEKEPHGASMLINTKKLRKVNGYNEETNCQDGYNFWLKFRGIFDIVSIPDYLFYYRQHDLSLSRNTDLRKARKIHEQCIV